LQDSSGHRNTDTCWQMSTQYILLGPFSVQLAVLEKTFLVDSLVYHNIYIFSGIHSIGSEVRMRSAVLEILLTLN